MRAAHSDDDDAPAHDDATQWAARSSTKRIDEEVDEADVESIHAREGFLGRPELLTARPGESDDESGNGDEADRNELSVDSLPSVLATDRTGVDEFLESMFTERTVDTTRANDEVHRENDVQDEDSELASDSEQQELGLRARQYEDGRQNVEPSHDQSEEPASMDYVDDESDEPDHSDDEQQDAPMDDQFQPSVLSEAKPHDGNTTISSSSSSMAQRSRAQIDQPSQVQQARPRVYPTATRIIAFDVGGKLFRCKESLIRKFPLKRLNQVISCGCERIGHDTFFIDRNPQHFEVILDWYRTGTYVRHPHVGEQALQEDAKYFDLLDELFPDRIQQQLASEVKLTYNNSVPSAKLPPRIPPRPHRQESSQPPAQPEKAAHKDNQQRYSELRSDNNNIGNSLGIMRFCKIDHRTIEADGVPVVFMVRKHEHLLVVSIEGRGKLMVRVCDATGLQSVQVPSAVLFDSQSHFYLQGGRAKLQNCLLPGGHTYTFWMGVDSGTANTTANRELNVEFKLLSTFRSEEQFPTDSLDEELQSLVSGASVADAFSEAQPTFPSVSASTFSPYMFLPPGYDEQRPSHPEHHTQAIGLGSHQRVSEFAAMVQNGSDRDAIAQQLFLQSHNDTVSSLQLKAQSSLSLSKKPAKKGAGAGGSLPSAQTKAQAPTTLKRNGAAIVAAGETMPSNATSNPQSSKRGGRITIYRNAQLKVEQTPRESQAPSPHDTDCRVRNQEQEGGVKAKYHGHQPRLFR